jgi:hypothetical protein
MRNVDGSFFGKSSNGETCKFEKGGSQNGPAILPAYNNSLATLSETISGIASTDGRLRQSKEFWAYNSLSLCYMAKCDIEMAYRNLTLSPTDYHLFGFKWRNLYYYDKCLAMGCSSACQILERFSTALVEFNPL